MDKPYIIEAENIDLTYEILQSFSLKNLFTGREQLANLKYIHALKNISFKLEKGHNLGIIGTNGSGKSTLLRVLSQTYMPDRGSLKIHTDSINLLTLGAGFMGELTGRDNLYLSALLLGISKQELDQGLAKEIIAFSEIGYFIDLPINTYSSGMKSRLMFSISACIQPELLLIDEVFSVGDAHFVQKSEKRMQEMIHSDKTVVLISHNTKNIIDNCDRVLWLHKGEGRMFGDPKEVMEAYLEYTGATDLLKDRKKQ